MASPRVIKIFEALKEGFHNLGYPIPALNNQGKSTDANFDPGCQAVVLDFDAASWVTGNRRVVVLAEPAGYNEADAVKTQSHASGYFIDGSVKFKVITEAQAGLSHTSLQPALDFEKFYADCLHILRGQLSAPIDLYFCDNTEEPKIAGLNSAGASSIHLTKLATLLPYGRTYPGGI